MAMDPVEVMNRVWVTDGARDGGAGLVSSCAVAIAALERVLASMRASRRSQPMRPGTCTGVRRRRARATIQRPRVCSRVGSEEATRTHERSLGRLKTDARDCAVSTLFGEAAGGGSRAVVKGPASSVAPPTRPGGRPEEGAARLYNQFHARYLGLSATSRPWHPYPSIHQPGRPCRRVRCFPGQRADGAIRGSHVRRAIDRNRSTATRPALGRDCRPPPS